MLPGVLRFSHDIELNEEIVVVTSKGEAVCLGNCSQFSCVDCFCRQFCGMSCLFSITAITTAITIAQFSIIDVFV
jgi:hypothetical protein